MNMQPFPTMKDVPRQGPNIKDATLRDFSGGLLDSEPEVVLESRYSAERVNFLLIDKYSLKLRYGTKRVATFTSAIVAAHYFGSRIIVVCANGTVHTVNDAGVTTVVWNTAIAALLPGAPLGWNTATHISFAEMNSTLQVVNNVNKPITIDGDYIASYLADPTSGSNVNTPIAKHIITVNNFAVMADDESAELYISSSGTTTVWVGDAAPNDATRFNLGSFVGAQSKTIVGLVAHSNLLYVLFLTSIVIVKLGIFDAAAVHRPEVVDVITEAGAISSKSAFSHPEGLVCFCVDGAFLITTSVFGKYERKPLFTNIRTRYMRNAATFDDAADASFVIHNSMQSTIFFFTTKTDDTPYTLAYTYGANLREGAWTEIAGWAFAGGTSTALKRVLFFQGTKLYQYGNNTFDDEDYLADYINDTAFAADGLGAPIPFVLESPWLDANSRLKVKRLQFVTGESTGNALFLLDIFVDKYYKRLDNSFDSAVSVDLVAGSGGGFGLPSEGYGGGRVFSDERYHKIPAKCKIFKYRISGSTRSGFVLTSLSFIYAIMGYKR